MPVRKIITYPKKEKALRQVSQPVRTINRRIKNLIKDLKDTLTDHPEGAGLAAIQIDIPLKVFVVRFGANEEEIDNAGPPVAMINAEVVEAKNEAKGFDGCLSLPGLYGDTVRPKYIRVKGLDEWGKPFDKVFEKFDAVLIHHEIDHTNGVLFIDRVTTPDDVYTVQEDDNGELVRVPVGMSY